MVGAGTAPQGVKVASKTTFCSLPVSHFSPTLPFFSLHSSFLCSSFSHSFLLPFLSLLLLLSYSSFLSLFSVAVQQSSKLVVVYDDPIGEEDDPITLNFPGDLSGSSPQRIIPQRVGKRTLIFNTPGMQSLALSEACTWVLYNTIYTIVSNGHAAVVSIFNHHSAA